MIPLAQLLNTFPDFRVGTHILLFEDLKNFSLDFGG